MGNSIPTKPVQQHVETGVIKPDELYHIEEAKRRLAWGAHAMRQARRKGLLVRYIANRGYLFGADIIAHVREHGKSSR